MGGTVQVITKSPFDSTSNIKIGAGNYGARNAYLRYADGVGDEHALAFSVSHRALDNDWRRHNEFESNQLTFKYGYVPDPDTELELQFGYTASDLELPGSMSEEQFEEFQETGEQLDNNSAFKNSGRYSDTYILNALFTHEMEDLVFRPRVYYTHWSHDHPVTGAINETPGVNSLGTDIEFDWAHRFWGESGLVAGITLKYDTDLDSKKYEYRDVRTIPTGRIIETLSDSKGELMEEKDSVSTVYGMFAQETMQPSDRWLIDLGFRLDRIGIDQEGYETTDYDWASGSYVPGVGEFELDREFTLFAPRLGVSFEVAESVNIYGALAQGEQVPFSNELDENPDLDKSTHRNAEVGLKGRSRAWFFDLCLYYTRVTDEVVQVMNNQNNTTYDNAGRTDKLGVEFEGQVRLFDTSGAGSLWAGGSYSYTNYEYVDFVEPVRMGPVVVPMDRSGNKLPYVPEHQYSLILSYLHPVGVSARVQANTWGEYYMDNANSETFEGYDLVTTLDLAYQYEGHRVSFNVKNLFDELYSVQATKSLRGTKSFAAGTPRAYMLSYRFEF